MARTIESIQFYRNGVVITPTLEKTARELAVEAINANFSSRADGEVILARYQEVSGSVKTIVGFIYSEGANKSVTILDVEKMSGDTEALEDAVETLRQAIAAMDKEASAENGKVVTTISEVDGVVSETKANVKDLQLGGYSKEAVSGSVLSNDTINTALSRLENEIRAARDQVTASSGITVTLSVEDGYSVSTNFKESDENYINPFSYDPTTKAIKLDGVIDCGTYS